MRILVLGLGLILSVAAYCQGSDSKPDGVYCVWGTKVIRCQDGRDVKITRCQRGCVEGTGVCIPVPRCTGSELVNRAPPGIVTCRSYLKEIGESERVTAGTNYSDADVRARALVASFGIKSESRKCSESVVQFACSVAIPSCLTRTALCDYHRALMMTACNISGNTGAISSVDCADYAPDPLAGSPVLLYVIVGVCAVLILFVVIFAIVSRNPQQRATL